MVYLGLAGLLISGSACDVLEHEPQAEVSEDMAISNLKGAQAALAGMYDQLQSGEYYGRNFQIMSDVSSDQAQSIGSWDFYREMDTYLLDKGNIENGNLWTRAYRAVNIANNILDQVPKLTEVTEDQKNSILGQAYFVRALAYFDLTRMYGGVPGVVGTLGVPIVTTPSRKVDASIFPSRATLQASYDHVESDLLKSLELLPEAHASDVLTRSQAVKSTSRALLSRFYLYVNKPERVIEFANQVIANPRYMLVSNFPNIYASKFTSESVFELNFNNADPSGIRTWYFPSTLGGRGDIAAHTGFYEKATADPKDIRGTMFGYNPGPKVYYPTKYQKAGNIDNIHIIRIAEVYLNRAEARAKTGDIPGALSDLNMVRSRAGATPITNLSGSQAVLEAIWNERNLELAFEGHSFFDLVRTGQALKSLVAVSRTNGPPVTLQDRNRQVFPIPTFDIDANPNLVQNEAYK
ncbi:RagB/SusD family nutrient uptake outer membrane protein [Pontibacter sp. JH31]|uniref:RagB/SusD family nutrient uptake outer membrane protein n=2 Tax=Pontibacter aquaedesilientis TaxID=2766980 RepID=A0ABR7XFG7_9BACT|nr:RagB/SusD family nutrient uptake outer membrane protein [Pontibacter aquaedesilientis]